MTFEKTRAKEIDDYIGYLQLLYALATSMRPEDVRYMTPERAAEHQQFLIDNAKPILDEIARIEAMRPPPVLIVSKEEFDEHFADIIPDSKGG